MMTLSDEELVAELLKKPEVPRRQLKPLSEYYDQEWRLDAWLTDRSVAEQGASLLQAKLKERQQFRDQMLAKLAKDKGVSPELLREVIISGKLPKLSPEERAELGKSIERYKDQHFCESEE